MACAEVDRPEVDICPRCGLRKWTRELERQGIIIRFCDECYWGRPDEATVPEGRKDRDPTVGSQRTVILPTTVQAGGAKAVFKNGILEVRVPKAEEAKSRTVKVEVAA